MDHKITRNKISMRSKALMEPYYHVVWWTFKAHLFLVNTLMTKRVHKPKSFMMPGGETSQTSKKYVSKNIRCNILVGG